MDIHDQTLVSIENSTTQILENMSCSISYYLDTVVFLIIYNDGDELLEIECDLIFNTLVIIDSEYKLIPENLGNDISINNIPKKLIVTELNDLLNNVEYISHDELNDAMRKFLNNIS